ncbi:protein MAIN-LIKE 2-like [Lathyrus oleraceus]|uniref:protein MAIN-LIKE 2-like n=1 Tax=Pisum sativum TaxID=3888 RepID=UPI0021D2C143|nr:protein MAIN-LIKE 2-like [Pisum sativum]
MSLLTMGDEHRGTIENISTFDPKRFRCRVHEYVPHDPLIEPYIRGCGFGNLLNIVSYSVDYKFILALLERWRPETHTFHLPIGECTVTLEDVYMLLGLRIDGKAVNGKVNHVNDICNELLGAPLLDDEPEGDTSSQARGQGINLKYLRQYYNSIVLSEDSTEYEKIIKARCYIMILFGNFLFPESTGNSVNIMYLPLLRNINKVNTYSWGSAVLAHLYSALCKNAKKNTCTFFSCAYLLQAWGWSRMSSLAPENERPFAFPFATK